MELDKSVIDEDIQPALASNLAIAAVENSQSNQIILVRKYLSWLMDELDRISPPFPALEIEGEPDDLLVNAINQTGGLIFGFAHLASSIAITTNMELILTLYRVFDQILNNYMPQNDFSGRYRSIRFDFYKFLGHEMFVCLIAVLIRENKWEFISELLEKGLYVENTRRGNPNVVPFGNISDYVEGLENRNKRLKLRRVSLRADMLNERHTKGELAKIVSMRQFVEADYFLFLREGFEWRPWSVIYMDSQPPRFLIEASLIKYAEQLLRPLSVKDITTLRARIAELTPMLRGLFRNSVWFDPLADFNPNIIGSR
jgi:hypothetical protein